VDHLGSTDVLTDDNGSVIGRMSYDPFGAARKGNKLTLQTVLEWIAGKGNVVVPPK
jgi:hypothetical protein